MSDSYWRFDGFTSSQWSGNKPLGDSFTMPNSNVGVTANFTEIFRQNGGYGFAWDISTSPYTQLVLKYDFENEKLTVAPAPYVETSFFKPSNNTAWTRQFGGYRFAFPHCFNCLPNFLTAFDLGPIVNGRNTTQGGFSLSAEDGTEAVWTPPGTSSMTYGGHIDRKADISQDITYSTFRMPYPITTGIAILNADLQVVQTIPTAISSTTNTDIKYLQVHPDYIIMTYIENSANGPNTTSCYVIDLANNQLSNKISLFVPTYGWETGIQTNEISWAGEVGHFISGASNSHMNNYSNYHCSYNKSTNTLSYSSISNTGYERLGNSIICQPQFNRMIAIGGSSVLVQSSQITDLHNSNDFSWSTLLTGTFTSMYGRDQSNILLEGGTYPNIDKILTYTTQSNITFVEIDISKSIPTAKYLTEVASDSPLFPGTKVNGTTSYSTNGWIPACFEYFYFVTKNARH